MNRETRYSVLGGIAGLGVGQILGWYRMAEVNGTGFVDSVRRYGELCLGDPNFQDSILVSLGCVVVGSVIGKFVGRRMDKSEKERANRMIYFGGNGR